MRKKITIRILLAGILAALLAGTAKAEPYTFTDDLGREITVDAPTKVIPTIGSYTKIWMLAGGTDSIVAASNDSWEEFHLELPESAVNLGKTKELNLELLAAQEPDLILASANTQSGLERLETYENMGLTAAYFTVNNVNDYLRMLKICTDITGNEAAYEQYGTEVFGQVQQAKAMDDGSHPTVLYVRISGKGITAKSSQGNILGEMLLDLGADNIADREESVLEDLNMEIILKEDPEYLFVVKQIGDQDRIESIYQEMLTRDPAWGSLSAVKEGRIYLMDADLYNLKPCERWGEAYLNLAEILYEKD